MITTRLAVLPNWLGDLVMAEPALRAWGQGHQLIAVVDPALADLVRDAGLADHVEIYDRRGHDRGPMGLWRRGRQLARYGAREALVLGPSLRAAALAAATGAEHRRGFGGRGRELFLTDVRRPPRPRRGRPLADTWAQLAGARPGALPRWQTGGLGQDGWGALLPELGGQSFAAFAAGARYGSAKQWDAKHFASVAETLRETRALLPVFVGSSSEGERALAADLAQASGGISMAGRTDLPTLAALLRAAAVCVANDSGPMHLASALGTPTVGLFGSTNPAWTAPRGPFARTLGPSPVPCSPCYLRVCPYARECYAGITPEQVLAAIDALLASASLQTSGGGHDG